MIGVKPATHTKGEKKDNRLRLVSLLHLFTLCLKHRTTLIFHNASFYLLFYLFRAYASFPRNNQSLFLHPCSTVCVLQHSSVTDTAAVRATAVCIIYEVGGLECRTSVWSLGSKKNDKRLLYNRNRTPF